MNVIAQLESKLTYFEATVLKSNNDIAIILHIQLEELPRNLISNVLIKYKYFSNTGHDGPVESYQRLKNGTWCYLA